MEPEREIIARALEESIGMLGSLLEEQHFSALSAAVELLAGMLDNDGKLLLFGNGGSAADASHIATEFVGRFLRDRAAAPAISLSDNAAAITAIANDYGFEQIFARQVEALARPGDVALAISTSGNSPNVVAGARAAREREVPVIGLTGAGGGALAAECEILITAPSSSTPRVQEAHTFIAHALCELVERRMP
jgi:D-sedoheptulose 7-phosphate isomerase